MSNPFCAAPGVALRVGYCGQTTARILVASLRGGTVAATCSGGTVTVPALVGHGDDNPAHPGLYVCATGVVEIAGLSPFTQYSYSITVDGITRSGSFRTLPADSATDYGFLMWTCEHRSAGSQWQRGSVYQHVREVIESSDVPILFAAHIDDLFYPDIFKFFGVDQTDPTTGLYITAGSGQQGACATGLQWDYAVSWCAWLGLLPSVPEMAEPHRQWVRENLPLWAMWGDHEIEGDHCSVVYDGLGANSVSRGCNRSAYNNGEPNMADLESRAEAMYEAFCVSACAPPRLAVDGGPANQPGAQYWGAAIGPVRFFCMDRNKYSEPYNACDAGDSHSYGRGNFAGVCSGATLPTRSELGYATDTQPAHMLGAQQLDDMLNWLDADEPFKVVFGPTGISRHNQPWSDMWPQEFDDYIGRAGVGLLKNSKTNGATGYSCHLKGDTHGMSAVSYHADGTAGGLGGTGTSSGELWEICPGTINGSTIGGSLFGGTIHAGGKLRYVKCGKTQGDRTISAMLVGRVYASRAPQEFQIDLVQLPNKTVLWSGYQQVGQGGNHFQYRAERRGRIG